MKNITYEFLQNNAKILEKVLKKACSPYEYENTNYIILCINGTMTQAENSKI